MLKLDAKGRLRIPAKYRDVLEATSSDGVVVTSTPRYLVAYTPQVWEEIEAKAMTSSQVQDAHRGFVRYFISSAEECELDKQGRILIPALLRQRVGIDQEVMVAGMLTNFEIWDRNAWESDLAESGQKFPQIAEEVKNLGI